VYIELPITENWEGPSLVHVSVGNSTDTFPSYRESLEYYIDYKEDSSWDYRLVSREQVKIAGVRGEQIVHHYNFPSSGVEFPMIECTVFFDYGGMIWEISMDYRETNADRGKAEFEHLLKTFRILD